MAKAAGILKDMNVKGAQDKGDTVRIWESYREQAMLWRALALVQIPATLILALFALILWNTRVVTLNVPPKPLPGYYVAQDVPDSEFIDFASSYVNLIATYQHAIARRQFTEARIMLWDKMLDAFDNQMMKSELEKIETTGRTQVFFVDPTKTQIERVNRTTVHVFLTGDRIKVISGRELPMVQSTYKITLTTVPKTKFNPYGIVIINALLRDIEDD